MWNNNGTKMELIEELKKVSNSKRKKANEWFFKTNPGDYGEGDKFIGVSMPNIRLTIKEFNDLSLERIQEYLASEIHEVRMASLLILVHNYQSNPSSRELIVNFYLNNSKYINNWDLVDSTAHKILGHYLFDKPKDIIYKLSHSQDLWERRISIISTFYFISKNKFSDSLKIAENLLHDSHDLIHKAVGWMLREIGNRDLQTEEDFLKKHYKTMPRTMLRYAIEKFPEEKRQAYLKGKI
jgi:3-methyladenine DNA glycosylase AlkD